MSPKLAVVTVMATFATLTALGCTANRTVRSDWSQWRGPNRNGLAPEGPALPANWPQSGLQQIWQSQPFSSDVGDGSAGGYGSVVVADERVYAFVNRKIVDPDEGSRRATDVVLCWNAATGKPLWKNETPGSVSHWGSSSTPCIVNGRCYVIGGAGTVYCLDSKDGSEIWAVEPSQVRRDISSSIEVVNGKVILMCGLLTALDAKTGDTLWQQPALTGSDNSTVLWRSEGQDYLICNDEKSKSVACVSAADGKVLWTTVGGGKSTAVVVGDTMVVLTPKMMLAYTLTIDGPLELWRNSEVHDRGTSPVIYEGHVYHIGSRGSAACIELATGQLAWLEEVPDTEISSPIVVDGKIIVQQEWGKKLTMIRPTPQKYDVLSQVQLPLSRAASPAVVDGKLYVRLNHAVACYDLTSPGAIQQK